MKNFLSKTKANSYRKDDKKRIPRAVLFVVIAFLILVVAKGSIGVVTSFFSSPLFSIRDYLDTSTAVVPMYIKERSELVDQIHKLQQTVASQYGITSTLTLLQNENTELRALLGDSDVPSVVAGVIARPPMIPYDTVLLDKGRVNGIEQYSPVYVGSHTTIGYVREVYTTQSLVTLFSSPGVETTVYVYGPNIFTTAYGEGGGVVRLSIPQGLNIKEGDVVILPSLNGGVLGSVSYIQSVATEPEQHAYVTSQVSLQSVRLVRVDVQPVVPMTFPDALRVVENTESYLFRLTVPEEYDIDAIHATTTNEEIE